jgi:1-acyl-sn-glycerol-3-phosphate acyltransferase
VRHGDAMGYWRRLVAADWPGLALAGALAEKFLAGVDVVDPLGIARVHRRSCLYLANHQVFLESLIFNVAVPPLVNRTTIALGKKEHRDRWLGRLIDALATTTAPLPPPMIEYFDRENPDEIVTAIDRLAEMARAHGQSVLVHVEGTRRRSCRRGRVQAMSPLWPEVAVERDWPIIPVRFVGGLPVEDLGTKLDAPVGFGQQTIRLGAPIFPEELRELDDRARVARVRGAINDLTDHRTEEPSSPDPRFAAEVHAWVDRTGVAPMAAVILVALRWYHRAGAPIDPVCDAILAAADGHEVVLPPAASALGAFLLGAQAPALAPTRARRAG